MRKKSLHRQRAPLSLRTLVFARIQSRPKAPEKLQGGVSMQSRPTRVFAHASRLEAGCNCFRILLALLVVAGISSTSALAQSTRLPGVGTGTVRETPPQVLDGTATV